MPVLSSAFRRLLFDDSGQDLIEYALLAALLAVASVATMLILSNSATNIFNPTIGALQSAS